MSSNESASPDPMTVPADPPTPASPDPAPLPAEPVVDVGTPTPVAPEAAPPSMPEPEPPPPEPVPAPAPPPPPGPVAETPAPFADGPPPAAAAPLPPPVPAGEPPRRRWSRRLGDKLLWLTVIVPTLFATVYYGLIASDVYVSESRFVVRAPDKPAATGLGVLLKSAGFSNAGDEIYAARDFVTSRDALAIANRGEAVRTAYTRPEISWFDRFNKFSWDGSFEDLFRYYLRHVSIEDDTVTSISTLTVKAYTPQDAQKLNALLLEQAEAVVNRLNLRGRNDLIDYARTEAIEAEAAARAASGRLAAFRNRSGVIDPERQAAVQLQLVSKLQDELIGSTTLLKQLTQIAPQNPQIPLLRTRIAELERQIGSATSAVAGDRRSLSANAAEYQRLQIDREIADKRLAAAVQSMQEAVNEARRKQAYVERIVQPNRPDDALEPRRLRGIVTTFIVGLLFYGIASMLLAGLREHRD